jgi:hypothetical protein
LHEATNVETKVTVTWRNLAQRTLRDLKKKGEMSSS